MVTLYLRFNHGYVSIFPVSSVLLMGCLHFGWSIVIFSYFSASQSILLNNRVNFQPLVNDLALSEVGIQTQYSQKCQFGTTKMKLSHYCLKGSLTTMVTQGLQCMCA